ncbi:NAD-P-binding protein [Mycena vulgaris]|nr:NAD-P-binding protein [Mycena vulgaris]
MSSPNSVALVTGCSEGGIGFHLCQSLVARGFTVYATSRLLSSTEKLDHPLIKRLTLDVTSDAHVNSVVATIMNDEGHIDLLINNAGVFAPGPIVDWTAEEMKVVYDANVFSIFRLTSAIVPHMARRSRGTIVNIGSIVGEFPTPWTGVYDSSKAAVRALTEVLAMECKPFNIHVMLVAPASVASDIMRKHADFALPENSIYGPFLHNIIQRLSTSKRSGTATPGDRYVLSGGHSILFRIASWLPRSFYLHVVWRMFSKPEKKIKCKLSHVICGVLKF